MSGLYSVMARPLYTDGTEGPAWSEGRAISAGSLGPAIERAAVRWLGQPDPDGTPNVYCDAIDVIVTLSRAERRADR